MLVFCVNVIGTDNGSDSICVSISGTVSVDDNGSVVVSVNMSISYNGSVIVSVGINGGGSDSAGTYLNRVSKCLSPAKKHVFSHFMCPFGVFCCIFFVLF